MKSIRDETRLVLWRLSKVVRVRDVGQASPVPVQVTLEAAPDDAGFAFDDWQGDIDDAPGQAHGPYVFPRDAVGQAIYSAAMPANEPWDIVFDQGFLGGDATFTYEYNGIEHSFEFRILGLNPTDATAIGFIDAASGRYWYTSGIAYHESLEGGEYFCQFNPFSIGADLAYHPLKDATLYADGFGIMMVDPPDNRSQVWHWKLNALEGVERIAQKERDVQNLFRAIDRTYHHEFVESGLPPAHTPTGTSITLTPLETGTIQLYNGGAKILRLLKPGGTLGSVDTGKANDPNYGSYASAWTFNSAEPDPGQRWQFVPNGNDYVREVIAAYEGLHQ